MLEDCVRHPALSAVVQGRFHVGPTMSTTLKNLLSAQAPAAAGCVEEGQEVVLSREILKESPAPETPPNIPTSESHSMMVSRVRFEFRVLEQNSGLLEWDGGWLSGVWGRG